MSRPVVLDLFCGAGGAALGYYNSGFDVIGVDIRRQPRYPFEFFQLDAVELLSELLLDRAVGGFLLRDVAAIHASPPCQRWSVASNCRPGLAGQYPDLIGPARELLKETRLPYVIENIPRAPLIDPVMLCGCHFGLRTEFNDQVYELRRPRGFETNWELPGPGPHYHVHRAMPIFGHDAPGNRKDLKGPGFRAARMNAMQIDWMTRDELSEAIPPAFTEYIGGFLWDTLKHRQAA